MLNEHTVSQLRTLRLDGMVHALHDQASGTAAAGLGFEERLAMLVQREIDWRDGKRLARLLKAARLKVSSACIACQRAAYTGQLGVGINRPRSGRTTRWWSRRNPASA